MTTPPTDDSDRSAGDRETGVPAVDEVLQAVEGLEERPIDEHVGVFEAAHARLREVLDDPGDGPAEG